MEKNVAKGFAPNSSTFFNLVRTHTIQGMFSDPYYGGNANFVGWDLIGYPGLRMAVTEGTSGARNPTLTAQALAWRTAEHLTKHWKAISNG
jgi:hypothetical protein